jgi:hypothetical protein
VNDARAMTIAERDLDLLAEYADRVRGRGGKWAGESSCERRVGIDDDDVSRAIDIQRRLNALIGLPGGRTHVAVLEFAYLMHGSEWRGRMDVPREIGRAFTPPDRVFPIPSRKYIGVDERRRGDAMLRAAAVAYAALVPEEIEPAHAEQPEHERRRQLHERTDDLTFVYFIQAGIGGPIKIGIARSVANRLKSLQTSHPEPLTVLAVMPSGPSVERALHDRFAANRLRGEWFSPAPALLRFTELVRSRNPDIALPGSSRP